MNSRFILLCWLVLLLQVVGAIDQPAAVIDANGRDDNGYPVMDLMVTQFLGFRRGNTTTVRGLPQLFCLNCRIDLGNYIECKNSVAFSLSPSPKWDCYTYSFPKGIVFNVPPTVACIPPTGKFGPNMIIEGSCQVIFELNDAGYREQIEKDRLNAFFGGVTIFLLVGLAICCVHDNIKTRCDGRCKSKKVDVPTPNTFDSHPPSRKSMDELRLLLSVKQGSFKPIHKQEEV